VVNDLYRDGVRPVRLMIWGVAFLCVAPVPVLYRSLGLTLSDVIQWVARMPP